MMTWQDDDDQHFLTLFSLSLSCGRGPADKRMALQQQGESHHSKLVFVSIHFRSQVESQSSKLVFVSTQFYVLGQVGVPQMVMNGDTGQLALAHADANR